MSGPWLPEAGVAAFAKYVVPGEEDLVFVTRRHPITVAEPVGTALASGIVALWIGNHPNLGPGVGTLLTLVWLVIAARAACLVAEWRASWFATTGRRLLLSYGLVTHKVAMMPLLKVTDMSYERSPLGQLLGYGEFVLESAGQEQAMRNITFVPRPDETYRLLVSTMFATKPSAQSPVPDPPSGPEPAPRAQRSADEPTVVIPWDGRDGTTWLPMG